MNLFHHGLLSTQFNFDISSQILTYKYKYLSMTYLTNIAFNSIVKIKYYNLVLIQRKKCVNEVH